MTTPRRATRDQALAFRLDGHNLASRRPVAELLDVAAACGIRNTPPGSAVIALHARVSDHRPDAVADALDERSLVEVLSVRISPLLVPARDATVFMLGALPNGEESIRAALGALMPALDQAGVSGTGALEQTVEAARAELANGPMTRGALSKGMTGRLPAALARDCRACDARHVGESLFRLAGVAGAFVIARSGRDTLYVGTDARLGAQSEADRHAARTELLRRYLRCFGPSTAEHFAAWAGIGAADARQSWNSFADRPVAIDLDGRPAWLHADDLDRFDSPPTPAGVRLLPPYDAYLDQRDRATLIPDKDHRRQIWKAIGNPGVVLADGEVVGPWRPRKSGKRLVLTVEPIVPLTKRVRAEIEAEASRLAPLRSCTSAEVTFAG